MEALALIIYILSLLSGGTALFLALIGSKAFDTVGGKVAWVAALGIGLTAFLYST